MTSWPLLIELPACRPQEELEAQGAALAELLEDAPSWAAGVGQISARLLALLPRGAPVESPDPTPLIGIFGTAWELERGRREHRGERFEGCPAAALALGCDYLAFRFLERSQASDLVRRAGEVEPLGCDAAMRQVTAAALRASPSLDSCHSWFAFVGLALFRGPLLEALGRLEAAGRQHRRTTPEALRAAARTLTVFEPLPLPERVARLGEAHALAPLLP